MVKFQCKNCSTEWFVDDIDKQSVIFCPFCKTRLSDGKNENSRPTYDSDSWKNFEECYTLTKIDG